MTLAHTLEVVHCLMNNVKVVMNGAQGLLSRLQLFNQGVVLVDGRASMDGIWKALGKLLLSSGVSVAETD